MRTRDKPGLFMTFLWSRTFINGIRTGLGQHRRFTNSPTHNPGSRTTASVLIMALAVGAAGLASSSAAMGEQPTYNRITIDNNLPGAAFVVSGNVALLPRPELVVSAFGLFGYGPTGPIIPAAGTVSVYRRKLAGGFFQLSGWEKIAIVKESDGITFPI